MDKDKLEMLDELSVAARVPRAILMREAIDDLLEKHRVIWSKKRAKARPVGNMHRARLAKKLKSKSK